jgi:GTP-binding protein
MEVYHNRKQRIPGSQLNKFFLPLIENYPPKVVKGKLVKVKYVSQLPTTTPTFAFFCNLPQYVREDYVRFLENKLRENFNFTGVPISIVFRKKGE